MRISVDELSQNMIINQDVYSQDGSLILSKGLSVSDVDYLKTLLKKHNIQRVKVLTLDGFSNETDSVPDFDYKTESQKEIQTFLKDFSYAAKQFEDEVVNEILSKNSGDIKKIESILEDTLKANNCKNTNVFLLLQKLKDSDDFTFVHCSSVALTSHVIGKWLNLSEEDLKDLSIASLLFDIGKYNIPSSILSKKSKLTSEEFEIVKTHVEESLKILENYDLNDTIIDAIKYHHERCDGSGYPYGLKDEQIPIMAKIIALSDMFVALTSKRPYRPKYTPFEAIRILQSEYSQKLDIVILSKFIKETTSKYVGSQVLLSNGQYGEILFINATAPLRPIVKLTDGEKLLDLSASSNANIKIEDFL